MIVCDKNSYDVIVVGGGPAGCAAAVASAREGARTLLIEQTGALGGMGTSGLVPAWCPFSDKKRIIYGGIAERVFKESKTFMPHVPESQLNWVPIHTEKLKIIYDDLVTEHGVEVLFHTFLAEVRTAGGMIECIRAANKSGLTEYKASVYIDCTGDADLAAWGGADFHKGDGSTGELQPLTHCFKLANVNMQAFRKLNLSSCAEGSLIAKIVNDDKYSLITDSHRCCSVVGPGILGFNSGHIFNVDATDPRAMSQAMMTGRKIAGQFHAALQEYATEAFGESYLVDTAPLMGVRETRRIIGDYILTAEDYKNRQTFEDEICRNAYYLDLHETLAEDKKALGDVKPEKSYEYAPGESHGIPYRCLVPLKLHNVLVAGRAISTDRLVNASIRVMPVCLAVGEAAGIAGAMAAAEHISPRDVNTKLLRNKLRENGAYLPE